MFASDFMDTRFHALHPQQSVAEAVSAFQKASESEGKKIFGMMVTDHDQLVGILSMYRHPELRATQTRGHIGGDGRSGSRTVIQGPVKNHPVHSR
jgi:hypothetical protein